jgi:hypothetical protein
MVIKNENLKKKKNQCTYHLHVTPFCKLLFFALPGMPVVLVLLGFISGSNKK